MKKLFLLFLLFYFSNTVFGQRITVNTNQTPTQLIENVLLNSGVCGGVTNVSTSANVATTGANSPFGSYIQNGTNNLFTQGMIISTGYASRAGNTNITTTLSDNIGTGGDTDLANAFSIVAPATLSDAAYIEFDFTPIKNNISFRYFLASEEYEYNKNYPCQFSDAFAFLIKDVTTGSTYQNMALIPTTTIPVGISTVHPDLSTLTGGCPASYSTFFNGYNQNPPNVDGSNFNGSTKAFTAATNVIPGHTYHIKLVIADYGSTAVNRLFDSAVFLEAGSFDLSGFISDTNNSVITGSTNACTLVAHSQILNPLYQWYHNGVAIAAPQGTSSTYSIPVGNSGSYSVIVTDSVTNCIDSISPVTVVALNAPVASSPQSFCIGSTLSNLIASGSNLNWYSSASGGTPLASTTVLTSGTYYVSQTVGSCESIRTAVTVVIGNPTTTFNAIPSICAGSPLTALPTSSNEGIIGTWSPALNNTATTTYTFTPNPGQCGTTTTLTITVTPNITPTFNSLPSICAGATISPLPTTSNEGIIGSWSPALNNTATTTYTFTPNSGQCSFNNTLTINVNPISSLNLISASSTTNQNLCNNTPINPIVYNFGGSATNATISGLPTGVNATISGNTITISGTPSTTIGSPFNYSVTTTGGTCGTSTLSGIISVQNNFDFIISGGCDGKNYKLGIEPANGTNLDSATINWQNNGVSTGISGSSFNVSEFVHNSSQTIFLPVSINATITNSAGCSQTHSFSIADLYCDIQKGISPNGDTKNDFFDLINLNVKQLSIFNRYGMKVFSKAQYSNEWIGQTDSGSELPDGTYYYVIEFNNQSETKTGWIYLIREH